MDSDLFPAPGGAQLFVNAYIRSTMEAVRLTITECNSSGTVTQKTPGPVFDPLDFGLTWSNYLHRVGSWKVRLDPATTNARVSVSGAPRPVGTPFLDVDTVSAAAR